MTANILFEVDRKENVLLVSNAALRWTPAATELIDPKYRDIGKAGGPGNQPNTSVPGAPARDHHRGTLWVEDGNFVKPIKVRIGLTDGLNTEVISDKNSADAVSDGMQAIIGEARSDEAGGQSNPFMPKFGKRR
jgi:HlyD family secretion protein